MPIIEPVGLDELLGPLTRDVCGGNYIAAPAMRVQMPRPAVTARTRFVHHEGTAALGTARERLTQRCQLRRRRADEARGATSRFSYRDGDGILVNIQPDVGSDSPFHGSVSRCSGTLNPYGSVHVARRPQRRNPRYGRQTSSSNLQLSLGLTPWART